MNSLTRFFVFILTILGLVISLILGYKFCSIVLPEYTTLWALGQTFTIVGVFINMFDRS